MKEQLVLPELKDRAPGFGSKSWTSTFGSNDELSVS